MFTHFLVSDSSPSSLLLFHLNWNEKHNTQRNISTKSAYLCSTAPCRVHFNFYFPIRNDQHELIVPSVERSGRKSIKTIFDVYSQTSTRHAGLFREIITVFIRCSSWLDIDYRDVTHADKLFTIGESVLPENKLISLKASTIIRQQLFSPHSICTHTQDDCKR